MAEHEAGRDLDTLKPYKCRVCSGTDYRIWGQKQRRRVCLSCHKRAQSESYQRNREKIAERRRNQPTPDAAREYRRKWALAHRYGITPERYAELLELQGGACAICRSCPGDRRLAVDHCHTTGLVRGLLCDACNIGLSRFQDDPNLLLRARIYLCANE